MNYFAIKLVWSIVLVIFYIPLLHLIVSKEFLFIDESAAFSEAQIAYLIVFSFGLSLVFTFGEVFKKILWPSVSDRIFIMIVCVFSIISCFGVLFCDSCRSAFGVESSFRAVGVLAMLGPIAPSVLTAWLIRMFLRKLGLEI